VGLAATRRTIGSGITTGFGTGIGGVEGGPAGDCKLATRMPEGLIEGVGGVAKAIALPDPGTGCSWSERSGPHRLGLGGAAGSLASIRARKRARCRAHARQASAGATISAGASSSCARNMRGEGGVDGTGATPKVAQKAE
jgi:hypothetical protein